MSPKRHVVMIGVSGCSGSGKTVLANRLVELLNSPLRPIALDDFFDEVMCEALGTCEDPRCIRSRDYARFLCEIRKRLQIDGVSAAECLQDMAGASAFLRSQPVGSLATGMPHDSSLEASSREQLGEFAASFQYTTETMAMSERYENKGTVYVVCEGFLLFVDQTVCDVLDYFLLIDIDEETASLRRFLRLPRRHLHHGGYAERIERMFCSRKSLLRLAALTTSHTELPSSFAHLYVNLQYVPPLPSVTGDYERFWLRREYLQYLPPMPPTGDNYRHATSPYAWLEVKDPLYITRTLQQSRLATSDGNELKDTTFSFDFNQVTVGDVTSHKVLCNDRVSILQKQYFEFRYWFFYEVLYYHRQLLPLVQENITETCQRRYCGKDAFCPIVHVTSGVNVSDAKLDAALLSFVHYIMQPPQSGGMCNTGMR
ncbi:hypothetical protein MOQ_008875 [Trypanosoma cruzi marinkellei]|uniref:Phosphoribulokinase/uridine kinase domain-containing protein n=1 Tax=Trypanosoma cruzi marinkellei TaxID=85056 RepID=K2MJQ5_TRYCR|nr:hypothetical protein MOQ_008875 [Trypanosoma cruzi marinkellei]